MFHLQAATKSIVPDTLTMQTTQKRHAWGEVGGGVSMVVSLFLFGLYKIHGESTAF